MKSSFVRKFSCIFIIVILTASFITNTAVTPGQWKKYIPTYKWESGFRLRNDYDPIFLEFPRHFYYPAADYDRGTDKILDLISVYSTKGAKIYVGTGCTDIYPALLYKSKLRNLSNIFYLDRTGYIGSGLISEIDYIFLREGTYETYCSNEEFKKIIPGLEKLEKAEFIINPDKENGIIGILIYKTQNNPAILSPDSPR